MMNKSFNLLAIVLLVFLLGFFLPGMIDSQKFSDYKNLEETFEILSELFSVFVALSIFAITWHAYDKSKDNHSLFLGITFLISGLLILCHLLSYPFMPDFITPNTDQKSAIFFLESRLIMAFMLLASVYIHKDSLPKLINKYVMVLFINITFLVFLSFLLFNEELIFQGFNLDGYSAVTVVLLLLITIIILVTFYLYKKRAKETFQTNLNYLANGSIILLVSSLVYFSYEFSGHFLMITGFYYFYLGLYKSSVERPYEWLAISEEKLRRAAEEKYRRLFDNANDAVVTIDMGGHVTSWNKSAQKIFGWTLEEITGKRFVEATATPETANYKEKMICELISDTVTGQETVCMRRDGTKIDVSVTVSPVLDVNRDVAEMSLIIRDITEKKKSKEALRKSEKFSRTVLNSMNDGIMVIDAHDFNIVGVNSFLLKKYGLKEEEVIGKKCFEVTHNITEPCYRREELCPIFESIETGKYSTVEHVHYGKNGEKIHVEVSTSPIKDDTGKVVQIIHVARDITERKQAEEKISKSLEEKEVLLREIHHRVKNNMQIISSLLMLQSQNIEDKKYKDVFIESQTRIHSMALIHEKLYQSENIAQINFKEYIDGIVSNIFESYNIKMNIKIDINVENIPIKIDYAVPCGLIINELVTNSLKYAFPDKRQGKIQISIKSKEINMIQISISDDGIGIPKDLDIRNTKSLGLHLVTALAEGQLHGQIILNREKGTEFQINFRYAK